MYNQMPASHNGGHHAPGSVDPTPLIPPGCTIGPDMDIVMFCDFYKLSSRVLKAFCEQMIEHPNSFQYLMQGHLVDMNLAIGEVAAVQCAIAA